MSASERLRAFHNSAGCCNAWYAYVHRSRDTIKLFCYDACGVWICAKRLEQGTFRWPAVGDETVSLKGLADLKPMQWLEADITYTDGATRAVPVKAAIDTFDELDYFRNGGILHYVLRGLARDAA